MTVMCNSSLSCRWMGICYMSGTYEKRHCSNNVITRIYVYNIMPTLDPRITDFCLISNSKIVSWNFFMQISNLRDCYLNVRNLRICIQENRNTKLSTLEKFFHRSIMEYLLEVVCPHLDRFLQIESHPILVY